MIRGKNPMLLNVTYVKPREDNGYKEYFEVVYRDDNGEPRLSMEPAEADIYIVKPEFRDYSYNKPQERIDKMDKVRVPISKILKRLEKEIGPQATEFVNECKRMNESGKVRQLYKWPYAFGCDFQPEHYFMRNWYEKYPLPTAKLTKSFLDIEVDQIDCPSNPEDIPNTAYAPVNCVTVIMEENLEAYTFILRPYQPSRLGRSEQDYQERLAMYEKQKKDHEYLMSHQNEFIQDLHQSFDEIYGYINYHIKEFTSEIELIADIFRYINYRKPNFCMIWNMRFDIQYLFHRIRTLGYDPRSIMCHPDFRVKMGDNDFDTRRCAFKVDKSTFLIEKQFDVFYCSSYTNYICEMRMYSNIRKSQHKLRSVSLNAIGDRELKDKKVEYPEESNIITFPYHDWIRFIKYNIKDVLLQLGIERKTNDALTYYMRSQRNNTPYNKMFRETHLLRNVREKYFEADGWVQGNNLNTLDPKVVKDEAEREFYGSKDDDDTIDVGDVSFKGAINADPIWNDKVGLRILERKSNNIFRNSMDYDMGAFYPSIKISSNMDPSTLLFKASFDNDEFMSGEFMNRSLNQAYFEKDKKGNTRKVDFTGEAVNTFASGNIMTFGYNYLNLPDIASLEAAVTKAMN